VGAVRVFISSVTYALSDERAALASLLKVVPPYEPLRFEDFTAQGRTPREACLAGVEACDVYVLLLGPRYGEPFPDSGLAPTEEEFTLARRQGKEVLVFLKETDEPDEPRQAAFKARVQDYVGGRFRASFTDPLSLNQAVMAALADVTVSKRPLAWSAVPTPVALTWLWDQPALQDRSLSAPVFDVHLVPVPASSLLTSRLQSLPSLLARQGREQGFFAEEDALQVGGDGSAAWAWAPDRRTSGVDFMSRQEHTYRGVAVYRTGQVSAFDAFPTDFMGTLVNDAEIRRRSADLLRVARGLLDDRAQQVAVASSLGPLNQVFEGDPRDVNGRQRGSMRSRQGMRAVMEPQQAVPLSAVRDNVDEIAAEIAAEIMSSVRTAPR
jgi:hypothetical protein